MIRVHKSLYTPPLWGTAPGLNLGNNFSQSGSWAEHETAKLLDIIWGTKMISRVGGQSHLQLEILGPSVLDHWFRTEFERGSEKGLFVIYLGMQEVWYSQEAGVWFPFGFDAITVCIEMGY